MFAYGALSCDILSVYEWGEMAKRIFLLSITANNTLRLLEFFGVISFVVKPSVCLDGFVLYRGHIDTHVMQHFREFFFLFVQTVFMCVID